MVMIETRCTQCGNENTQDVKSKKLKHGSGREHGVERVHCETCGEITPQNRYGKSVPQSKR